MKKLGLTATGLAAVMLLNGCATMPPGPSVTAIPPQGKPFELFQQEKDYCKAVAQREVAGQAETANDRAVGTAVGGAAIGAALGAVAGGGRGAAVGAAAGGTAGTLVGASGSAHGEYSIQRRYDNAYTECMIAKGNSVQGHAAVTVVHPVYAPPPAVIYTPPPAGYAPPPGAVPAPAPQGGYAPPPGAVAPPANLPPPQ
jgi:uncharacterized protein YcfJ